MSCNFYRLILVVMFGHSLFRVSIMKIINKSAESSQLYEVERFVNKVDVFFSCVHDLFFEFNSYFKGIKIAFLNLKLLQGKELCLTETDLNEALTIENANLKNIGVTCQKREGKIIFSSVPSKLLCQVDAKQLQIHTGSLELAGNIFGEVEVMLIKNDAYHDLSLPIFFRIATDKFAKLSITAGMKNALNFSWYGQSLSINEVLVQCEQASLLHSPTAIVGASGSGKVLAAYSVHCFKVGVYSPFIILDCSKVDLGIFRETLTRSISLAVGGSLYLKKLSDLTKESLNYLIDVVREMFRAESARHENVNIILSINSLFSCLDEEMRSLINHLMFYCYQVNMPSLNERWLDVPYVIKAYKENNRINSDFAIANEAWSVLSDYSWDGNFSQFEAFLVKCDYLRTSGSIDLVFLSEHFPQITDFIRSLNHKHALEESALDVSEEIPVVNLVLQKPKQFHPALLRACEYISKNYNLSFNMMDLSQNCLVSSSHLSAILKKDLGSSFKQLLNEYRIYMAKNLIEENPSCQITVVAQDCGYTDLSHFEKTFKKLVGISPGSYRSLFRETLSTEKGNQFY